jgi:hypothetical protein
MNSEPYSGWNNPKVLTLFAVIFLCGLACGAALWAMYVHSHMQPAPISMERLKAELHLNGEQRQAVDRELDEYAKYYQNIEEERQSVADQGKKNMLKVLTPDQQKRFLQLFQFPVTIPCQASATQSR